MMEGKGGGPMTCPGCPPAMTDGGFTHTDDRNGSFHVCTHSEFLVFFSHFPQSQMFAVECSCLVNSAGGLGPEGDSNL